MSMQVIRYNGPRLVHEPFLNELHSTVFATRVILTNPSVPIPLLKQATTTASYITAAEMLADYLEPLDSIGTATLVALDGNPSVVTVI